MIMMFFTRKKNDIETIEDKSEAIKLHTVNGVVNAKKILSVNGKHVIYLDQYGSVKALSWQRGYKGVFYVFHSTPLKKVDITIWAISDFERRNKDAIAIKYFRKFVAMKMAELSIPLDVIDFIQGRKAYPRANATLRFVFRHSERAV